MSKIHFTKDDPDRVLVYSTDPIPPRPKAMEVEKPYTLAPAVRLEKKGRGGKSVTVLFKLPPHETLLEHLCTYLKRSIGSGGTSYIKAGEGIVEIQGEHRQAVLKLVDKFVWPPRR